MYGRCQGNEPDTLKIGNVDFKFDGNEMMIEIPKCAIGIEPGSKFRILFKWVDSRTRSTHGTVLH